MFLSFIYLTIHSFTHSFIHPSTHSFIHLSTHLSIHSFLFSLFQWEVKPPMPSQAMRSAVKQVTKLHEAMSSVLPEPQVEVRAHFRCTVCLSVCLSVRLSSPHVLSPSPSLSLSFSFLFFSFLDNIQRY